MVKPKHISPKLLALDEKVVLESRMSTVRHMTGGITSIVVALAMLLVAFWNKIFASTRLPFISDLLDNMSYGNIISIIFILLALMFFIYFIVRYLRWISTLYVMTNERVMTKRGILGRDFDDMPLRMITNVDVNQSVGQRLMGYGTVVFSSQSGTRDDVIWKFVPNPVRVRRMVQESMDQSYYSRQK
jgi:uncharacterized membrane protein YdbT with pleckstrin-like domain